MLLGGAVMKRTALATALILALMVSAVAGAQLNLFAKANFLFPPPNPAITIASPTNSSTYNVSTLSLKVTVTTVKTGYETNGVSRLFTYALDGQNPENITITNSSDAVNAGAPVFFVGLANLTELTEGMHNLTVRVTFDYAPTTYSKSGYYKESESTVNFNVDTVPPEVVILSLENKTYFTTDIPLNFVVHDDSQITYSLDGQENITFIENTTLTSLPHGEHNVTVYAEDVVGNVAVSTIRFNIEPFPTTLIISTITVVAVVTAGLLVYFKKRKRQAAPR
jgi:hypothetical protein